ncbi:aldo/keto reductase [Thermobaculum terrenum ATCC BAA-798]|uniref:Aldo/keto reductase n=1 Tax=Thermobaculum terrenum (strain ATCC BAA-798 / CCMEE 7001 / YNP1) TaxID=525904 RepID=D1CBR4_THET1|nr:aldo/keto reductase [Thermobaculum terrenum]ACZ42229.1 aldo/keto reductase [Thermobaculum terrenum ATCC BAA-798]
MDTRRLGNTDMMITPIGFGAWAIGGGGWASGWGPQDDNESIAAIHKALDLGINWIDTAAVYGLGHSEEVVARALDGISDRPYIFTKCGLVWDESGRISNSLKRDSIRRELEASLRRLRVEVIDLYQIHWPNPDEDIEEGWSTLAELQQEGKVRYIGVSNFSVEQMQRAMRIAPISSLQPPYNLLNRSIEKEILPFCQEHNIGVIAYSPMASGLLTGKVTAEWVRNLPDDDWRKRSPEFNEPRLSRNLKLVEKLREIGSRHGKSPAEVAIAWVLRHPAVTGAIVGARRPDQVEGIIGAADFRLSQEELDEIEQFLTELDSVAQTQ